MPCIQITILSVDPIREVVPVFNDSNELVGDIEERRIPCGFVFRVGANCDGMIAPPGEVRQYLLYVAVKPAL